MRREKPPRLTIQKKLSHRLLLSQAEPPSFSHWKNKSSPTPLSPSICWSCWAKYWQTIWQCFSSSGEVHYHSHAAVHQAGHGSGISYVAKVPPPLEAFLEEHFYIWSTSVNQSIHRAPFVYHTHQHWEQEMTFIWQIGVRQIISLLCFQPFIAKVKQCATINTSGGKEEQGVVCMSNSLYIL